jgi:hypothetical protein
VRVFYSQRRQHGKFGMNLQVREKSCLFPGCIYFVWALHLEGKCKCVSRLSANVYLHMNNVPGCGFKLCKILFSNFLFLSKSFAGSEGSLASGCREKIYSHRQQLAYGRYVANITLPCISPSIISCRLSGMKVFVVDPCISGVATDR